jgi:hypothetical protein
MTNQRSLLHAAFVALMALCLMAMSGEASAQVMWGLTENQTLVRFSAAAPGTPIASLPVTGLQAGEQLVGIEVEWESGAFVGVSTAGRVYMLNRRTGAATAVAQQTGLSAPAGTAFGLTDHPQGLFLVSTAGGMILQRHAQGTYPTDGFNAGPGYVAIAWKEVPPYGFFMIDAATDTLLRRGTNDPTPETLGSLGVDTSDLAGLDADPHTGTLYATLTVGGVPGLYTLSAETGQAALIGPIGSPMVSLTADFQAVPLITEWPQPQVREETNPQRTFVIRRRGDDTVAADMNLNVDGGIAFPPAAIPNQDFVPRSEVLHFAIDEVEKTIAVTVLDDAVRERDKSVRIRVDENVAGGLMGTTEFLIIDDENQVPILTITQPVANSHVQTATITVSGTVADPDEVTVKLFLIGGLYVPFAVTTGSPFTFTNVPLQPGLNSLLVIVTDPHGLEVSERVEVWRAAEFDQTFVFAEGSTGSFFHTDLLFMNPHPSAVPVTIEFMREDGVVIPHAMTLPAERRATLDVSTIAGLEGASFSTVVKTSSFPIVVERTMRWDDSGYGAHTEKASAGASQTWYFAEGAQGFMHTYLLLVNPQGTANEATVRFLREQDTPVTKTFPMGPRERLTVDVGSYPDLVGRSFGIEVTFTQPGMAERAMYFGSAPFWSGGHESAGATSAEKEWFLAEGATGPFFKTFVLVANPGSAPADLTMRYLTETGAPVVRTRRLEANSRLTVNIENEDPGLLNVPVATQITSTAPVVVERAQYWPGPPENWYEGHGALGVTDRFQLHWGLAEGRVGGPEDWQTYILVANTYEYYWANVIMRFYRQDGAPVVKQFTVPPNSRFTVAVGSALVPEITAGSFGVDITSSTPIVVERAMYGNANGVIWAAGTSATATKLP